MLTIVVPDKEYWDEAQEIFLQIKGMTIELEHSLVSLSKWEQHYEKAFLGDAEKTTEETLYYIECMTLTPNVPAHIYKSLTVDNLDAINTYIARPMTATTFHEPPGGPSRRRGELITAEIIYYWLIAQEIPFEVQDWHLNRLLTQVRVVSLKNAPKNKMSRKDQAAQQRLLNSQRQAQTGTKG